MSKKVLVIDDSATVRQQVRLALTQAGFDVVDAVDGVDGAAKIEAASDLSAVICDVNMPRKNGIEMLEEVRGGGRHAALPFLVLTTEGQPKLIQRAKAAGAKGWIIKPFKPELLVAALRKVTGVA
jgi:two-component system, chemotaxis family, chemotaxis protein CheY